jgi:ribose-phosphate pyrophosphokinase
MPLYLNEEEVIYEKFPNGEIKLCIENFYRKHFAENKIKAFVNNSDDFMALIFLIDAVKRIIDVVYYDATVELILSYIPYSRQDRVCNPGESLSVKCIADIINSFDLDMVSVADPHSDVIYSLLNKCKVFSMHDCIENIKVDDFIIKNNLKIICPDAGAIKKIHKVQNDIKQIKGSLVDVIYATKIRNTFTGKITQTCVEKTEYDQGYIILDDICDGGRTFIEIAKILKEREVKDIYLYITHGFFTNGLDELKEYFKKIYCFNNMSNIEDDFIVT